MIKNNHGRQFLDFIQINENRIESYQPLAGSFAVITCNEKYLLCYNKWRKQWELPAGSREKDETPLRCAIRELYEETGQVVQDMELKGLLKVENLIDGTVQYNPVYFQKVFEIQPLIKNEETTEIMLWDQETQLTTYDCVDLQVLKYLSRI
ncbi:8-oxo-dGTP diphosphatase [Oceanobacillus limi]|uniref:8-oxo-dGTP diphosphatase n=1 Tax=Oceanobacillus limi TaxID=930131 RepID=A0A1I0B6E9_9BACI|nr:NUDIX hydrolase [Oceanobacillus limi]SET01609.1 8-oxo-dGTP diphosphatase [Oceanobacillus limi]